MGLCIGSVVLNFVEYHIYVEHLPGLFPLRGSSSLRDGDTTRAEGHPPVFHVSPIVRGGGSFGARPLSSLCLGRSTVSLLKRSCEATAFLR